MRVSVIEGDPGYVPPHESARCRVTLNGREVRGCVTADEEIGIVTFVELEPDGKHMVVRGGEVQYRRDVGKVEIIPCGR